MSGWNYCLVACAGESRSSPWRPCSLWFLWNRRNAAWDLPTFAEILKLKSQMKGLVDGWKIWFTWEPPWTCPWCPYLKIMRTYEQVFCLVVKIHCYRAKKIRKRRRGHDLYLIWSEWRMAEDITHIWLDRNGRWRRPPIADLMGREDCEATTLTHSLPDGDGTWWSHYL